MAWNLRNSGEIALTLAQFWRQYLEICVILAKLPFPGGREGGKKSDFSMGLHGGVRYETSELSQNKYRIKYLIQYIYIWKILLNSHLVTHWPELTGLAALRTRGWGFRRARSSTLILSLGIVQRLAKEHPRDALRHALRHDHAVRPAFLKWRA